MTCYQEPDQARPFAGEYGEDALQNVIIQIKDMDTAMTEEDSLVSLYSFMNS
jgi:hypothetical protein